MTELKLQKSKYETFIDNFSQQEQFETVHVPRLHFLGVLNRYQDFLRDLHGDLPQDLPLHHPLHHQAPLHHQHLYCPICSAG